MGKVKSGNKNKQSKSLASKSTAYISGTLKFDRATTDTSMSVHDEDWGVVQNATAELERGLEAAGDGPPHLGQEGAYGGSGALVSTDTEELVINAISSSGDEEGTEHPLAAGCQRFSSFAPGDFNGKRLGAHKLLGKAAYYCATGHQMLQEHKKVQGQAVMYMAEVCTS